MPTCIRSSVGRTPSTGRLASVLPGRREASRPWFAAASGSSTMPSPRSSAINSWPTCPAWFRSLCAATDTTGPIRPPAGAGLKRPLRPQRSLPASPVALRLTPCRRSFRASSHLPTSPVRLALSTPRCTRSGACSWNRQLGDKASFALAYVGNHGIHEPTLNYPNVFASGVAGLPVSPLSGSYATVGEWTSSAVSNFNGLTASFNQRLTYGFTVRPAIPGATRWTKFPTVEYWRIARPASAYQINPFCLACSNYGNADYDIRNSFNASYVWQTPFKFSNKFANGAFGGWTLSQNFFARSGLPFTVLDTTTSIGNYNPNVPYIPAQVIGGSASAGQGGCTNGFSQCLNSCSLRGSLYLSDRFRRSSATSTVVPGSLTRTSPSTRTSRSRNG